MTKEIKKYSVILSGKMMGMTRVPVYELCHNGESLLDKNLIEIQKDPALFRAFAGALRIIEDTSNLKPRPKTKFRPLHNVYKGYKVYEAKSGPVRVYLLQESFLGRIILLVGHKNKQNKDINRIKHLIQDYHENK